MEIVRGDHSDIDALRPLWSALREHHGSVTAHWGPLRDEADGWEIRRATYVDILDEGGVLLLARDGETVAGFAICEEEAGGSPTWAWPATFLAIVDLAVLPTHRRRGIASALLRAATDEATARGVDALDVNAASPNADAAAFYEAHGFRLDLVTFRKPLG